MRESGERTVSHRDGEWLTVSQAAHLLGVSAQTVRTWSAAGRLPALRTAGGHRRYARATVEDLVAGNTTPAGSAPDSAAAAALTDIIQALAEERDPRYVVDLACGQLMVAMSATSATISFYDPEQNTIYTLADRGAEADIAADSFAIDDYPVTARVIHTQTCALVSLDDPDADAAESALLREYGGTSLLMAPLIFGGVTIGVAEIIDNRGPRHYSAAQMETLDRLCSQIALAVHITRLIDRLKTQHDQAQRRNAEFELLLRTAQSIGSSVELQKTLSVITQRITETLGVSWSDFYEWRPEGNFVEVTAYYQIPEIRVWEDWLGTRVGIDSMRDWSTIVEDHKPSVAYYDDPDITDIERQLMAVYDEKATIAVPVVYAGELIGMLDVGESRWHRRYTDDDVRLLQAIADQAASALHNAREYDTSRRRAAELATLLGVAEALASSNDIETMLGVLCSQLRSTLAVAMVEAYIVEADGRLRRSACDSLEPLDLEGWDGTLDLAEAPTMAEAIAKHTMCTTQIDDPELPQATRVAMERWHEQSALVVPMIHHGQALGVVYLAETRARRTFDERDIRLATAIASQGAVAVENALVYAQLTHQAVTDGLTGLHNRRYLNEYLTSEIAKARRYQSNLSVLMLDIDDFKRFNDTFGHPQGDKLLREIAAILVDCTRLKVDLAARYGGEEFCVVLPNTPPNDDETPADESVAAAIARSGAVVAERIRAAIAERRYEGYPGRREEQITASIGVAAISSSGESPEAVIADADKALYFAKNTGKNRVVVYRE